MRNNDNFLWKYAALGTQFLLAIGALVFIGIKTDKWIGLSNPIFVWVLPLVIITVIITKIIKDTTPKK